MHVNSLEGFFSLFKRGMKGVYQHCGHNHLHRYVAEYDFRYNNRIANGVDDFQRAERLLAGDSTWRCGRKLGLPPGRGVVPIERRRYSLGEQTDVVHRQLVGHAAEVERSRERRQPE